MAAELEDFNLVLIGLNSLEQICQMMNTKNMKSNPVYFAYNLGNLDPRLLLHLGKFIFFVYNREPLPHILVEQIGEISIGIIKRIESDINRNLTHFEGDFVLQMIKDVVEFSGS